MVAFFALSEIYLGNFCRASPILSQFLRHDGQWWGRHGANGEAQVPMVVPDGTFFFDESHFRVRSEVCECHPNNYSAQREKIKVRFR